MNPAFDSPHAASPRTVRATTAMMPQPIPSIMFSLASLKNPIVSSSSFCLVDKPVRAQ